MSLRTLKFGDRTISYDAGLNSLSSSDNSEVENTEEGRKLTTYITPIIYIIYLNIQQRSFQVPKEY